jgi:hypothetical protein
MLDLQYNLPLAAATRLERPRLLLTARGRLLPLPLLVALLSG